MFVDRAHARCGQFQGHGASQNGAFQTNPVHVGQKGALCFVVGVADIVSEHGAFVGQFTGARHEDPEKCFPHSNHCKGKRQCHACGFSVSCQDFVWSFWNLEAQVWPRGISPVCVVTRLFSHLPCVFHRKGGGISPDLMPVTRCAPSHFFNAFWIISSPIFCHKAL